jgi:hypothetical protein
MHATCAEIDRQPPWSFEATRVLGSSLEENVRSIGQSISDACRGKNAFG